MPVRYKGFNVKTKELTSPEDPEVTFVIRTASNGDDIERANMFSKVRYIVEEDGATVATEKDMPFGEIQVGTIKLGLESWNVEERGSEGRPAPITDRTIRELISPEERLFLYNAILDFNATWKQDGKDEAKSSS